MSDIRVGIVGIGNMGTAHACCIADGRVEGMHLSAVCDLREERLTYCRERFSGVQTFSDWRAMVDGGLIDALIVAVPHPLHADIAEYALTHGLHVLVEKPVDVRVSKAAHLNETARRSDRVFAIMFNQRTNELFARAREIVQGGALGELKRTVWIITNWYRTQAYYDSGDWRATWGGEGGGVLLNQAPHNLDLWQWICGMPVELTAHCDVAKYHRIEVEDDVTIFTRYANGATGVFITTTGECPGTNRLEISGDRGKLVLENNLLRWWRLHEPEREFCFTSKEGFVQPETDYEEIAPSAPEAGHVGILRNFAAAILRGEPLLSPGADGIFELTLSNAAYLSAWQGSVPVTLPPDAGLFDRLLDEQIGRSAKRHNTKTEPIGDGYHQRWQVRW